MPYLGVTPSTAAGADLDGKELILDADADTTITADTDDQIDIRIAGADDFQFTANTFTALSGSTVAIASGATIANSGTATGFSASTLAAATTVGDGTAEDTKIVFDGNAQDYYMGLDDTDDDFKIGLGSAVGTTAHMIFDETGAVTKPLQPGFFAYPSGALYDVTGDGTAYDVVLNSERFDTNSDQVNGVFTAPVSGIYHLTALVGFGGVTDSNVAMSVQIVTSNFTEYLFYGPGTMQSGGYLLANGGFIANMDAADTAFLRVSASSTAKVVDVTQTGNTNFCGFLVG